VPLLIARCNYLDVVVRPVHFLHTKLVRKIDRSDEFVFAAFGKRTGRSVGATGGIVTRHYRSEMRFFIGIAAMLMMGLQICPVARSPDPPPAQQTAPPSLGDVARKNREDKAAQNKTQATSKNTFTNDGLVSGKGGLLGASAPDVVASGGSGSAFNDAIAKLDEAMQRLDLLGSLDHANLFSIATGGASVDFPGRKGWEDRMLAARQNYVVHGKELIQGSKTLMLQAKALHDAQPNLPANDPRVQSFEAKLRANMEAADKLEAEFKAVAMEGHDRAAGAGK
jgi:hypothetical protein